MGRCYEQFSLEERCTLCRLSQAGQTIRQIATAMDRAPSTIMRELRRNSGGQVGYHPAYAEQQAKSRRWRGNRLLRKPELQQEVLKRLGHGWSPAQVCGRLRRENNSRTVLSYESIYRFIDAQIRRPNDFSWRHYLPRGKSKRGWHGHTGGSPVDHIEGRVSIERRPAYIHKRRQPGHWEGDLMLFAKYGQAVLVTHERRSRLLLVSRQPNKAADPVAQKLTDLFSSLPKPLRRTITFDNGTEFAYHYRLHKLSMRTFFCDPHAPWQKGGVENAIGRMRRGLPRKTDLATCPINACSAWFVLIITLRESALTTELLRRSLPVTCCTSNVNPPRQFARNDVRTMLRTSVPVSSPQFLHKSFFFDLIQQAHVDEIARVALGRAQFPQNIPEPFQVRPGQRFQTAGKKIIGRLDGFHVVDPEIFLQHLQAAFPIGANVMDSFDLR